MLSFAIRLYDARKTLDIDAFTELKCRSPVASVEHLSVRPWGKFLIPLLYRIAKPLSAVIFVFSLAGIFAVSGACLWAVYHGQTVLESFTARSAPPYSINLRVGPWEGVCAFSVNVVALLAAWHLWDRLRQNYAAQLLFLLLIMGVNGMVMTRDLSTFLCSSKLCR